MAVSMDGGVRVGGKSKKREKEGGQEDMFSSPGENESGWEERRKMRNKGRKSRRAVMSCRPMAA